MRYFHHFVSSSWFGHGMIAAMNCASARFSCARPASRTCAGNRDQTATSTPRHQASLEDSSAVEISPSSTSSASDDHLRRRESSVQRWPPAHLLTPTSARSRSTAAVGSIAEVGMSDQFVMGSACFGQKPSTTVAVSGHQHVYLAADARST